MINTPQFRVFHENRFITKHVHLWQLKLYLQIKVSRNSKSFSMLPDRFGNFLADIG